MNGVYLLHILYIHTYFVVFSIFFFFEDVFNSSKLLGTFTTRLLTGFRSGYEGNRPYAVTQLARARAIFNVLCVKTDLRRHVRLSYRAKKVDSV